MLCPIALTLRPNRMPIKSLGSLTQELPIRTQLADTQTFDCLRRQSIDSDLWPNDYNLN